MLNRYVWSLVCCLWVSFVQAGEISATKATEMLVKKLQNIQSMEASFEQWIMDGKQNTLQNVTGHMWVQRPGRFRWDTNEPYPQQIVSDGDLLWIYDKDLAQATKKRLDKQVGNTPALLLSGDPNKISDSFSISAYKFDKTGEWRFDLEPKDDEAMFDLLRVHFSDQILSDMFLQDNLGQTTRIEFKDQKTNTEIQNSMFDLKLDKTVDVIEEM